MATTVQDILIEALGYIGAQEINETPSPADLNTCLNTANFLIGSWSANSTMLRATIPESFTLTNNQASFTIGTGGNFNTVKPIRVVSAFLQDSSGSRYPINIVGKDVYDQYPDALISSGLPMVICYDPGVTQQTSQLGTIYVYPMANGAVYSLFLEMEKYLTSFVNLTDTVTFEPAYFAAICWNLAEWIWPKFNRVKPLPALIRNNARSTKRTIENMNARRMTLGLDLPSAKATSYNIYTDQSG